MLGIGSRNYGCSVPLQQEACAIVYSSIPSLGVASSMVAKASDRWLPAWVYALGRRQSILARERAAMHSNTNRFAPPS